MDAPRPFYQSFPRQRWADFREDTPLSLNAADVELLHGQNDAVSLDEVEAIYLPLTRLLNLYVEASQNLATVANRFLGSPEPKVPYIIGVAGSVAVGKSTTSRILKALLSRWPNHPRVELVTTDGYLYPAAVLNKHHLMERKGFPESYNIKALLAFLSDLKAGKSTLKVPIYSHHRYDILANEYQIIDRPDIVIVEGVNVLQVGTGRHRRHSRLFVSDFFDFSIYVDAPLAMIRQWYLDRFMLFRSRAHDDPSDYFHRFAQMNDDDALVAAQHVWSTINEVNLRDNILPFRDRARLILQKSGNHEVSNVLLRRL